MVHERFVCFLLCTARECEKVVSVTDYWEHLLWVASLSQYSSTFVFIVMLHQMSSSALSLQTFHETTYVVRTGVIWPPCLDWNPCSIMKASSKMNVVSTVGDSSSTLSYGLGIRRAVQILLQVVKSPKFILVWFVLSCLPLSVRGTIFLHRGVSLNACCFSIL